MIIGFSRPLFSPQRYASGVFDSYKPYIHTLYTYIHTHKSTSTHVQLHTYMHTFVFAHKPVYILAYIHSFIPDIFIAPLQVNNYSEALPIKHLIFFRI